MTLGILLFPEGIGRLGNGIQPFLTDRVAADIGKTVRPGLDFFQGSINLGKPIHTATDQQSFLLQRIQLLRVVLEFARLLSRRVLNYASSVSEVPATFFNASRSANSSRLFPSTNDGSRAF